MRIQKFLYLLLLLLCSCSSGDGVDEEEEDDEDACESISIEETSDFNFAGSNGALGVAGTFSDVYFSDFGLRLENGVAGSNTLSATIELDIEEELEDGNDFFNLTSYEGKIHHTSGTYSTLFHSSTFSTGGYLWITSYDLECKVFSGEYDIIGGKYNPTVNADNMLRIIGTFEDIGFDD